MELNQKPMTLVQVTKATKPQSPKYACKDAELLTYKKIDALDAREN